MDLFVINTQFEKSYVIDVYKSLIWTDRYNKSGDFEIYVPLTNKMLEIFQNGYYIQSDISDHLMIIENIKVSTDTEKGMFLIVSGRSLESILDRRIIWEQTILSENTSIDTAIKKIITDAIINPSIENRKISNFIYKDAIDPNITSLSLSGSLQFTGDNLYDAIEKICDIYDLGFKITLDLSNNFVFELISGVDRSYTQNELPYVEFSPNFDNLISSDYNIITTNYKNVSLVAGEGEGIDRRTASVYSDTYSGLNRRELYVDARDISSNIDGGTILPTEYDQMLVNRGLSKLTETMVESGFDAKVDYNRPYKYGVDYNMGDIVQFQNQLGISYRVQVLESIYSESENGIEQYPTFTILEED